MSYINPRNHCYFEGRVSGDVITNATQKGTTHTVFSIAVSRNYKNSEGQYDADFFKVDCWGKEAEYAGKFQNGDIIGVWGSIEKRQYISNNNTKEKVIEVKPVSLSMKKVKNTSSHSEPDADELAAINDVPF